MEQQLTLVESSQPAAPDPGEAIWELDDHTRDIGRRGVQQARQALRRAARPAAA
ncbi:MAG: hypothetical protein ABR511_06520 [Acidimicrobiales bacterium]